MYDLVQCNAVPDVQILKIVSHCDYSNATSAVEEWAFWHNQLVDMLQVNVTFVDRIVSGMIGMMQNTALLFTSSCIMTFCKSLSKLAGKYRTVENNQTKCGSPGAIRPS